MHFDFIGPLNQPSHILWLISICIESYEKKTFAIRFNGFLSELLSLSSLVRYQQRNVFNKLVKIGKERDRWNLQLNRVLMSVNYRVPTSKLGKKTFFFFFFHFARVCWLEASNEKLKAIETENLSFT